MFPFRSILVYTAVLHLHAMFCLHHMLEWPTMIPNFELLVAGNTWGSFVCIQSAYLLANTAETQEKHEMF
jgi:hypothetical protein